MRSESRQTNITATGNRQCTASSASNTRLPLEHLSVFNKKTNIKKALLLLPVQRPESNKTAPETVCAHTVDSRASSPWIYVAAKVLVVGVFPASLADAANLARISSEPHQLKIQA